MALRENYIVLYVCETAVLLDIEKKCDLKKYKSDF